LLSTPDVLLSTPDVLLSTPDIPLSTPDVPSSQAQKFEVIAIPVLDTALIDRYDFQMFDSIVVAAALEAGLLLRVYAKKGIHLF
jgi:hypothetical protein